MTIYQKLFGEYNQMVAQILMTKNTMVNNTNRRNAQNTFQQLLAEKVIPIVNENDSVSSYEFQNLVKFGDNDTLSSVVAALIDADLLILMSDIDGLFTDDPNSNPDAQFIDIVENMDDNMRKLGKSSTGSNVGTGGMRPSLPLRSSPLRQGPTWSLPTETTSTTSTGSWKAGAAEHYL